MAITAVVAREGDAIRLQVDECLTAGRFGAEGLRLEGAVARLEEGPQAAASHGFQQACRVVPSMIQGPPEPDAFSRAGGPLQAEPGSFWRDVHANTNHGSHPVHKWCS